MPNLIKIFFILLTMGMFDDDDNDIGHLRSEGVLRHKKVRAKCYTFPKASRRRKNVIFWRNEKKQE